MQQWITDIRPMLIWMAAAYVAVVVALAVDLATGMAAARRRGRPTTSRGLRRTVTKATHYFASMLCLGCVDLLLGAVGLRVPPFTLLMGAFNIICEWVSVTENTDDRQRLRRLERQVRRALRDPEVGHLLQRFLRNPPS